MFSNCNNNNYLKNYFVQLLQFFVLRQFVNWISLIPLSQLFSNFAESLRKLFYFWTKFRQHFMRFLLFLFVGSTMLKWISWKWWNVFFFLFQKTSNNPNWFRLRFQFWSFVIPSSILKLISIATILLESETLICYTVILEVSFIFLLKNNK